jgi:hypothetical protein
MSQPDPELARRMSRICPFCSRPAIYCDCTVEEIADRLFEDYDDETT